MDLAAVRQILRNASLRSTFQAILLISHEQGETVRELADQVGVSRATMYRWLAKIRRERVRNPKADLIYRPAAAVGACDHTQAFRLGRKWICLECLATNLQRELDDQKRTADAKRKAAQRPAPKFVPKGTKASA